MVANHALCLVEKRILADTSVAQGDTKHAVNGSNQGAMTLLSSVFFTCLARSYPRFFQRQ
jgi:hypothetical protein